MATVEFRDVTKSFGDGAAALKRLSLSIEDHEFMVLVGPSGCGKSTALRLVAGLDTPTSGELLIGGEAVTKRSPQERNVAMVFQNYALYPHKTVWQNLQFPLRMMKLSREEREQRIRRAAGLLGIEPLLDRRPRQLSGGQRQRVAMGRAIVRDPLVFLMDEPLSNLDAKLRVQIRTQIADLQREIGITTIYVTHDQVEAMTLGDRVAVVFDGELHQVAPAQEVYDKPVNTRVAAFIGSPEINLWQTALRQGSDGLEVSYGAQRIPVDLNCARRQSDLSEHINKNIIAGLRPDAFAGRERGAAVAPFKVKVRAAEALGHEQVVYFEAPERRVVNERRLGPNQSNDEGAEENTMAARLAETHRFKTGDTIELGILPENLYLFDENGDLL